MKAWKARMDDADILSFISFNVIAFANYRIAIFPSNPKTLNIQEDIQLILWKSPLHFEFVFLYGRQKQ